MIMSQSERQLQETPTTESPNSSSHKTGLRHHRPPDRQQSNSNFSQDAPFLAGSASPSSKQQKLDDKMAMQNLGQNQMQQEQQLKNSQSNSVNDTSWHNTSNDNPTDVRQPITCSAMSGNMDNINSNNNNNNNNVDNDTSPKIPRSDGTLTGPHRSFNRPPQHQQTPPQTLSQLHHGIFSPAILQSSLFASRVDQIIRTNLHDSPAYTPSSSKNSNTPTNNPNTSNSGMPNSTSSSNMPSPSSSLIFNQTCNPMAPVSSASSEAHGHPPNSSGGQVSTTNSPLTMGYGPPPTLASTSDMSTNNGANSNFPSRGAPAHSSASHSALAAAAALQSLNQSHFQRSQQQLAAHTQQAPFLNAAPPLTTKPPSNTSGTPVPQAAHGNSSSSSNHMPKMCITTSMANALDHSRLQAFSNDRPDNSGDFTLRIQPNNSSNTPNNNSNNNNKMTPNTSALSHLPPNWKDYATDPNGSVPRMMSAHSGANLSLPPFATSSSPYSLMSAHMPMRLNSSNSTQLSQDGDTLSRSNALRNANPSQMNDEKNGIPNFSSPMMRAGGAHSSIDLMRIQQTAAGPDRKLALSLPGQDVRQQITEPEKQAIFSYNLLSPLIPGSNRCKDIVHLDDDMRKSILNLEFYTKYEHIATGILTNTILVPNFSIIDYLRQSKFPLSELGRIEALNRKLSISDYNSLMELVRQKPLFQMTSKVAGIEVDRPPYGELGQLGIVPNMSFSHENPLINHPGPFIRNNPLMSSPNRNDMVTLQGIEKSRRSSQSPSDITRSQMGSNFNHSKFSGAQNQFSGIHNPPHSSPSGCNQFGPSPYSMNQQRNHQHRTSPQAQRHSPFQQPLGVCNPFVPRPPRSHSTIGGLNIGPLNASFTSVPVRQPPAAHQSSSRPNLSALASELLPPNALSATVPVTAHMSSKTPQTPRLSENLVTMHTSPTKTHPPVNGCCGKAPGIRELTHSNQPDLQNLNGRQDLDSLHGLPIQTLLSLRHQEMNNQELTTKRSSTPHYAPPSVSNIGHVGSMISMDVTRQGMIENNYGSQLHSNPHINSQGNNPLGISSGFRNSTIPNSNLVTQFNETMPPPGNSIDFQRQNIDSLNKVAGTTSSNSNLVDSQPNQYNSLGAYQQQQILLSNKLIDNGPGALPPSNMTNRANQSPSQRSALGEPISVHTAQGMLLAQTNSPKSNHQRSIITGTASTGAKKTKKAKTSPSISSQILPDKGFCGDARMSDEKPPTADQHDVVKRDSLRAADDDTMSGPVMSAPNDVQATACANESGPTRGLEVSIHSQQKNNPTITSTKSANLSGASTLPNISEQSFSSDEKSFDEPSLIESGAKVFGCTNETSFQNSSSTEPSKYQKLFTKKAWLKNYDEEDQARITEAASTLVSDKLKEQTELVKNTTEASNSPEGNADASHLSEVKSNGASKSAKVAKSGNKKKLKEVKAKKANSIAPARHSRLSNEGGENDSEETTTSTSDLDDTDETDSMKSSSDKKLRRMPRRKVKSNTDRDFADQPVKEIKTKITKDTKDKDVAKKRGKKEKSSESINLKRKSNSDNEMVNQKTKRIKDEGGSSTLSAKKRPGVEFLQKQSCYEIVPKGIRCLECRKVRQPSTKSDRPSKQASKSNWFAFCRFYYFRKLHYNKAGQIVVAGFCSASDATNSDKQLWLPIGDNPPTNITYRVAKYILKNIGNEFCKLVQRERMVINAYEARSGDTRATWKRLVDGMRELCDVCNTTLFNSHFVCERCGFVICIDCHQSRSENHKDHQVDEEIKKELADSGDNSHDMPDPPNNKKSKKDLSGWLFCANNEEHSPDKLALAKIIAGDCLEEVWNLLHKTRQRLNLGPCSCEDSPVTESNTCAIENVSPIKTEIKTEKEDVEEDSHSTLKGLLLASGNAPLNGCPIRDDIKPADLTDRTVKLDNTDTAKAFEFTNEENDESDQVYAAIEGCIASLEVENQEPSPTDPLLSDATSETHLRLCDGEVLVLTQSRHKSNTKLFRHYWEQGKPVLVRDIHKRMNIDMWLPQFFSGKFGEYRSDLVDCRNGDIHRQSMRKYWDAFEPNNTKRRSKDENVSSHMTSGNSEDSAVTANHYAGSALWRLKDWPPGQDFMEILPEHYDDFMNNLPLSSYTTRTGRLNLACRLPNELLKPDLGPKMYSAYGTTKFPERGTTNLHLDISDAVNVMVYVGGANPFNQGSSEYAEIFEKTIDECHVDDLMKAQIREQKLIPGALWHIFKPSDVEKLRTFLRKLSEESKIVLNKKNDPIHDQTWYLDQVLLDRLYKEHGVKSYSILQCMGDAILIPAGAPHQVKNLQNCIKVANDFVSPENVHHCLKLTNEFRKLPETHINQEDKLQIKNILYHSVKESIQYIDLYESGRIDAARESSDEDDCEEYQEV